MRSSNAFAALQPTRAGSCDARAVAMVATYPNYFFEWVRLARLSRDRAWSTDYPWGWGVAPGAGLHVLDPGPRPPAFRPLEQQIAPFRAGDRYREYQSRNESFFPVAPATTE